MRAALCIFWFFVVAAGLLAQDLAPDTILNLNAVNIYSSRISRFAKGQAVLAPDSLIRAEYPNGSLADLIPGFTSAYIRNYGQGTLSTLSFRGTSANHTGLLWNGIRVSPPNIGYVDLSLVQGNFFGDISVLYGGASPMFGSGSIGGSIHLENRPVFEKTGSELGLGLSAGSFGMTAIEGNGTLYRKKFYSRTAFTMTNAVNDFSYDNLEGNKDTLSHARILKSGIIQDIAFQLPANQYLMASAWFQFADRDIPPTLSEDTSVAVQTDRSWRAMILWKDFNERSNMEAKAAYFNEYTNYDDPSALVYSTIKSQSITGSFESTWNIGNKAALFAGSQFTYEYADLVYYSKPQDQENLAVYASYRHSFPSLKWQASLNGRQEFLSGYKSPFLFSVGAEGVIWRNITGRLNISRNFRAPTFNERFWQPGGNPDLEPEESWNEEAGVSIEKDFLSAKVKLNLAAFNSRVENWILWLPQSGSLWSVENAQEVWLRGVEISGNQSLSLGHVGLILAESYTFSKATNEKKLFDLDASYKKQLIYTPLHRFFVRTGLLFKGFNLTLKGDYTGEVFTSKDNIGFLPPFFLLDAAVSKSFRIKKEHPVTIQINLNNLLNQEYQVTPYRPMPGINFLVTVKAGFSRQSAVGGRRSAVSSR